MRTPHDDACWPAICRLPVRPAGSLIGHVPGDVMPGPKEDRLANPRRPHVDRRRLLQGRRTGRRRAAATACSCSPRTTTNGAPRSSPTRMPTSFRTRLRGWAFASPIAHDSYLINLASPDQTLWEKSVDALRVELVRAEKLGIRLRRDPSRRVYRQLRGRRASSASSRRSTRCIARRPASKPARCWKTRPARAPAWVGDSSIWPRSSPGWREPERLGRVHRHLPRLRRRISAGHARTTTRPRSRRSTEPSAWSGSRHFTSTTASSRSARASIATNTSAAASWASSRFAIC